jgi:hypothetical protein
MTNIFYILRKRAGLGRTAAQQIAFSVLQYFFLYIL